MRMVADRDTNNDKLGASVLGDGITPTLISPFFKKNAHLDNRKIVFDRDSVHEVDTPTNPPNPNGRFGLAPRNMSINTPQAYGGVRHGGNIMVFPVPQNNFMEPISSGGSRNFVMPPPTPLIPESGDPRS